MYLHIRPYTVMSFFSRTSTDRNFTFDDVTCYVKSSIDPRFLEIKKSIL